MPPRTPQSRQTATTESNNSKASKLKRKSKASATTPGTEPKHPKKVKAESKSAPERKVSNSESLYDSMIIVKAGEDQVEFPIHRGLLRSSSKFFKGFLSESETVELILEEENPHVLRRFQNWLYSGSIISEHETYKDLPWSEIVAVYAFGSRKGAPPLQNHCVDTVIRKRQEGGLFPSQAVVNTLWKAPGQFFRFRRLLLDMFAAECNLKSATLYNTSYQAQFLVGLVQTLYDLKEKGTIYDEIDFWNRRKTYYVEDGDNPILLD